MSAGAEYDPRYLAGILFFNRRLYFEAHEVWEDLWRECSAEWRRFYQGLIQAAVALHHWGNGNWRGARRLFYSGRAYMSAFPSHSNGLNIELFWREIDVALAETLREQPPESTAVLDSTLAPIIRLDPQPDYWPDPSNFVSKGDS